MKIFSLLDMKAQGFNRPFCSKTRATAGREIATGINNDPIMATNAGDFAIYEIGRFDPETGRIYAEKDPVHVIDVIELLEEKE